MSRFKNTEEEQMRDALRDALNQRGIQHSHTQSQDLIVTLPSGQRAVIEIKKNALHDSGSHSVYEALGQLFYHTRAEDTEAILVVAGPAVAERDGLPKACYGEHSEGVLRRRLAALGVRLLLAQRKDGRYVWSGLEELLQA